MDTTSSDSIATSTVKLRFRLSAGADQLLFLPGRDLLLVSTADGDQVISLNDGRCVAELPSDRGEAKWKWILEPGSQNRNSRLFLVDNWVLKEFDITDFPARADADDLYLHYEQEKGFEPTWIKLATVQKNFLILEVVALSSSWKEKVVPLVFDMTAVEINGARRLLRPLSLSARLAHKFRQMVVPRPGMGSQEQLLFLDEGHWLSSISLADRDTGTYTRHFPVPSDVMAEEKHLQCRPLCTVDDDIVLSTRAGLVVVKNGLKHGHLRPL